MNSAPLLKILQLREPDFIELSAAGSVLHSFYNGIENIFSIIDKHYADGTAESASWHKELLKNMQFKTNTRNPVISENSGVKLIEYMMFRHFFRHSYGFQLDWNKMKHLINESPDLWKNLRNELNTFIEC